MNTTLRVLVAALPIALAAPLLAAAPAQADDRRCSGTIGNVAVDGNVIVPRGATCTLNRTRVDGNVEVKGNARLVARGVRVDGNVQAENFRRVEVLPAWVNGKRIRPRVGGSVQLEQGGSGLLRWGVVGSDIQLFSNAGFEVRRNTVEGNLQCKSNKPRPWGGANRVQGNKEDQCRSL